MKALAFREHGGLDKLRYQDVPDPKLGDGDVLVRVRAAALNHLDLFVREGLPGLTLPMPFWTGCDIAGDVAEVGAAVQDVELGDRVAVNPNLYCGRCEYCLRGEHSLCVRYGILGEHTHGGLAEYVAVEGRHVLKLPDAIRYEDAAAFVLVNMTAWRMLVTQARLRAGEDLLILGVGGGVSSTAVQIGKLCGARVWVTSSSDDKLERARALGADECINYTDRDLAEEARKLTAGRGVDMVVENIGGQIMEKSIRALARNGRVVTCGATAGNDATWNVTRFFLAQQTIYGSFMGTKAELLHYADCFADGRLKPVVDAVLPLAQAREAVSRLLHREQFGKIVLVP